VRRLRDSLPPGARVGTVDRFQGQEAPVVIYSMATSAPKDQPRTMDFLYSLNRFNVAVSRAQALVVVVHSPELLYAPCRTPKELGQANALCWFVEAATPV
jgi:superfamily I DNA and/or RNA helicase